MDDAVDRFPAGGLPAGWYAIRPSSWLKPGQLEKVHLFGRDLIVYRTRAGRAAMVDPVCPHLGADFSLGRVEGEHLVCGMHGFEFDVEGRCAKVAYGTRPPQRARLAPYPVHETDGFVFAWLSQDRATPPPWKLEALSWDGWTKLRHVRLEFEGHPQEIAENSVDMGHFGPIHHYSAEPMGDAVADGAKLTAAYRVVRPLFSSWLQRLTFVARFEVLVHGLGYSLVHPQVERPPISIRYFINATPIDGTRTQLHLAAAIRKIPVPGLSAIVREAVFYGLQHDVSQDIPFWESKRHIVQPPLAEGDGPIGIYRRWCRQFYPERAEGDGA